MFSKGYRDLLLMRQVLNVIQKARRRELLPHGVTLEEFMTLYILQEAEESIIPTQISHLLCQERNTASVQLSRMIKKGLVKKVRNFRKDRRLARIIITPKGQRIFEQIQKAQARKGENKAALSVIFSCLSGEEHEKFSEFLLRLRTKALEELGEEVTMKWKPTLL